MVKLDSTRLKDWQIAEEAEKTMKPVNRLAAEWGILDDELLPYGHHLGKVDYSAVTARLKDQPNGRYIDVTAITPTPLGEGKSTTTMGLVQGLAKRKGKVFRRYPPAFRWTNFQYQGQCGRWRVVTVHPLDAFFTWLDRRYRRYYQCPQPGHGGLNRPLAA